MSREIENMKTAFRKARIEGAEMLESGRISWEDFSFVMLGFEQELRSLGVEI